jgi:hypothetical protein
VSWVPDKSSVIVPNVYSCQEAFKQAGGANDLNGGIEGTLLP